MKNRWFPEVCPITGLPFFMWIEHYETGEMVPTYGGPYDSYTIPLKDQDGSYIRDRYDHDEGGWLIDFCEDVCVQIVSDQLYVSELSPSEISSNAVRKTIDEAIAAISPLTSINEAVSRISALKSEIEKSAWFGKIISSENSCWRGHE